MSEPAPALGATDAPWLARLRRLANMPNLPGGHPLAVSHADLTAAVEMHDAQAARLAAAETLIERTRDRLHLSSDPYSRAHADWLDAAVFGAAGETPDDRA